MRRHTLLLLLATAACSSSVPTAPAAAPPFGPLDLTANATGQVVLVEFVDAARLSGPTVELPHQGASVAAWRVARQGESGSVRVRQPNGTEFWGVLHQTVQTRDDGAFDLEGLRPGELYWVMLTEEPKRGGCYGLAGMIRPLRVYPGIPVDHIKLSY